LRPSLQWQESALLRYKKECYERKIQIRRQNYLPADHHNNYFLCIQVVVTIKPSAGRRLREQANPLTADADTNRLMREGVFTLFYRIVGITEANTALASRTSFLQDVNDTDTFKLLLNSLVPEVTVTATTATASNVVVGYRKYTRPNPSASM